jgi:hypothetical protein
MEGVTMTKQETILKAIDMLVNEERMLNQKLDPFSRGFRAGVYTALRHLEDIRDMEG